MQILLITIGSFGDLLPFLAVGKALAARGHAITIATNSEYEPHVRRRGFDFAAAFASGTAEQSVRDPRFWNAEGAWPFVWERILEPALRPSYELVVKATRQSRCLVVSSWMVMGARLAQERHEFPMISVYLAPHALSDSIATEDGGLNDNVLAPSLNRYRHELGLAPISNVCNRWMHSPEQGIAFFPEWFQVRQPGWPEQVVTTGFPIFDGALVPLSYPRLKEFMAAGPPPVVFTAGTGMRHSKEFFERSLAACASLGVRALLLTPYPDQVPGSLPLWAASMNYVPLNLVLRESASLVYHGGIGTCAQAIRCGVPHLVVPMAFDQFDNAARIESLGLGRSLPMKQFSTQRASQHLGELLSSSAIHTRNRLLMQQFAATDPMDAICDAIERAGR